MLIPASERVSANAGIVRVWPGAGPRATVSNATAAVADHALMSAVSFAVGLAFIYRSPPDVYGGFVVLQAAFLLVASIQNAVVNTPMMVMTTRMSPEDARRFDRGLLAGLLVWGLPASVVAVLAVGAFSAEPLGSLTLVAVCFVPLLARDYLRAREFSSLCAVDALRRDSVYAAIVLCSLAALALTSTLSVDGVYTILAVAAAISVASGWRLYFAVPPTVAETCSAYRHSWAHSRWSLVGATASWVQGNAYVYIPFYFLGASAVAVLAAARLALMPVALLTQSWSNVQRPRLSRLLARGQTADARRTCVRGMIMLGLVLAGYVAAILLVLRTIPPEWLPVTYRDMRAELLMWSGIMVCQIVRNSVSWLLQAALEFQVLAKFGLWTAAGALLITPPALMAFGVTGGLVGMFAAEFALACALLTVAHRHPGLQAAA